MSKISKNILICLDKGCCCSKKTTSLTKEAYLKIHIGPQFIVEGRYAQICTTIFVCLFYSSGMPILYVSILLFMFITYWLDKWLFLRFYRIPPKYDLFISKVFLNFILFSILCHSAIGLWIYGNPLFLIDASSKTDLDSVGNYLRKFINFSKDSITIEIVNRITTNHNGLMICWVAISALILIFKLVIWDLITSVCCSDSNNDLALEDSLNIEIGAGKIFI